MGLFSSTGRKSSLSYSHDHDNYDTRHPTQRRRSSFARHTHNHEREQDFRSRNPYHRSPYPCHGFIEDEDHDNHHPGRRSSRRESNNRRRGSRAGTPSLSPTRATYENKHHISAYRQRTRSPRASSKSRYGGGRGLASDSWNPFHAQRPSRQRSSSLGQLYVGSQYQRRRRGNDDGGLSEWLTGLSMSGAERSYGRRRPNFKLKVERIYEID